jgi:hypothetical protein
MESRIMSCARGLRDDRADILASGSDAITAIKDWIGEGSRTYVWRHRRPRGYGSTARPYADSIHNEVSIVTPDSMPLIVWLSRLLEWVAQSAFMVPT